MPAEDILSLPPPPFDQRVAYGADPNQFFDVRLPSRKGPFPALLNIHGGFWRAKYGLAHAGHLCDALRSVGVATFNVEYRRVGNDGGGWPGTFADIRSAYRYVRQEHSRFHLDERRLVVIGHSAGGQLALCLAGHERSLEHYREADPMDVSIPHARQWLLHGAEDDTVPPAFTRDYAERKKKLGEHVELVEIAHA